MQSRLKLSIKKYINCSLLLTDKKGWQGFFFSYYFRNTKYFMFHHPLATQESTRSVVNAACPMDRKIIPR